MAQAASAVAQKISKTKEKSPKTAKTDSTKTSSLKSKSAPASKQKARSIPVTHADMEGLDNIDVDIDFNEIHENFGTEKCCAAPSQNQWENMMNLLKCFVSKNKKSDKKTGRKAGMKAQKKVQKKNKKAISKRMEKYALYGLIFLAVTFIVHRLFIRRR
ncbi:MAG: hypothetical protein FWH46_03515 [Methanimicrococcus sp.]|nr:hypothetical protein [Methanimicrococcus sp.]